MTGLIVGALIAMVIGGVGGVLGGVIFLLAYGLCNERRRREARERGWWATVRYVLFSPVEIPGNSE